MLLRYDTIQYDTIAEFNVDSKAECDQLKLSNVARKKIKNKKLKQAKAIAHLVQYNVMSVKLSCIQWWASMVEAYATVGNARKNFSFVLARCR